jgi:hypothetical protein
MGWKVGVGVSIPKAVEVESGGSVGVLVGVVVGFFFGVAVVFEEQATRQRNTINFRLNRWRQDINASFGNCFGL